MVVYRFKFDSIDAESGATVELLRFLNTLAVEEGDVINYLPSRKDVILGVQTSVYDEICKWISANINYKFEFEEHSEFSRTLTQIIPEDNPMLSVSYLLPLFTPESYLTL